jgi:ribose transport system permease protein
MLRGRGERLAHTATTPDALAPPQATIDSVLRSAANWPNFSRAIPYLLVPCLFVFCVLTIPGYFNKSSILSLFILSSFLGLASLGQTMTVIAGGVDLSIAAVMGLAEIILTQRYAGGWPFWEICLALAGLAILIGSVNALSSVILHVHPLITSFGMSLVVGGIALEWSHGFTTGSAPSWLTSCVSPIGKTGPIPVPGIVVAWIVAAVLAIAFMRLTRIGREIYATGANPTAARLARVRSTWTLVAAFVISAMCASIAGVFFAGYSGIADSTVGQPYFFETITAVVIGGTSLLGGRGGYGRTAMGALIVAELTTLLVGLGFNESTQELVLGILIIVLASAYGRELRVSARI